ncbi:MAG: peptidylprolyl isomerase [Candidatus Paceibacterota bacterium]
MNKSLLITGLVIIIGISIWLFVANDRSPEQPEEQVDTGTTTQQEQNISRTNNNATMTATIKTSKGDIELAFFPDSAPNTVDNFRTLAEDDFYEGVIFHRVIEGFMIQGGDPTGTGTGGPGYTFADELNSDSKAAERGYQRGTVAMANSGPNTNGSQFFIMHQDQQLPFNYTIFGYVTEGMDVVDEVAAVETDARDKPLDDIVIEDVKIESES